LPRLICIIAHWEWLTLACPLAERRAIGRDCLVEPCSAAFSLAKYLKRVAEAVLGPSPLEWLALACLLARNCRI
jgi:hypothetical protein